MFATISQQIGFISFQHSKYFEALNPDANVNTLYLLDPSNNFDIMEIIPRNFTITTNTGSSKFNIEMLFNSSISISNLFKDNVDLDIPYHLPMDDEKNVLGKFEQLYQGKLVFFTKDEIPYAQKITNFLQIINCPNFIKPEKLRMHQNIPFMNKNDNDGLKEGVIINKKTLFNFLEKEVPVCFEIKTNKNKYMCNIIGVYSSKVIHKILSKKPNIKNYTFDYEDEFGEFKLICDFFNFQKVTINSNNMDSLKKMANELQIKVILDKIDDYIKYFEKVTEKIDDQQNLIVTIENLFELLYKIKENSVEFVKNSIVDSFWSETKENVQELAAFILKVVSKDSSLHPYLADLLKKLDEEANESNALNFLLPFITKKTMNLLGFRIEYCSFVFNLHKNGLISKEKLLGQLKKCIQNIFKKSSNSNFYVHEFYDYYDEESFLNNIFMWFLPELIEIDLFKKFNNLISDEQRIFIERFLPDKIDQYKKMRDNNEPDDELTKSLINDDVETLQKIISKSQIDILKASVPNNMFDSTFIESETNFLDYSAAHGSIKCFKYLLLNHIPITKLTYKYAIYGGNVEIIRIVDQNFKEDDDEELNTTARFVSKNEFKKKIRNEDIISPSIVKHRNDLFDWILENKFNVISDNSIQILTQVCASNGNAHALIEIIDKGYTIDYLNIIKTAWKNGFYRLSLLILNFVNDKSEIECIDFRYSVYFGNLSILKLCIEIGKNKFNIQEALFLASNENLLNIIEFYFDNLINKSIQINEMILFSILLDSIVNCSDDVFDFLLNKYKQKNAVFDGFNWSSLINQEEIFQYGKSEVIKTVIDLILENSVNQDFTIPFVTSALNNKIEICKYIVDKHLFISYEHISSFIRNIESLNIDVFAFIYNHYPLEMKEVFRNVLLNEAILHRKKEMVEFLLNEKAPYESALLKAVEVNDLEIVDLILKYDNKPSFVNKKTNDGTALLIAVQNNSIQIVKRLLSVPGINADLYDKNRMTPLMIATDKLNEKIIFAILDFYGDDIINSKQNDQIDYLMTKISSSLFSKHENQKSFKILKKLKSIEIFDFNFYCEKFNLLTIAVHKNDLPLVEFLSTIENININFCDPSTGNSPLMISIEHQNHQIFDVLLKNQKTNINIRNLKNETALIIACNTKNTKIVDRLINDKRFDPDESRLNFCFYKTYNNEALNQLYTLKSLDVNYKSFDTTYYISNSNYEPFEDSYGLYETTLTKAVRFTDMKKIDLIIKHPSFDKNKSCLQKSIFIAVSKSFFSIFQTLFNLINNDAKNYSFNGKSLFDTALYFYNADVINVILNSTDHVNTLDAFIYVSNIKENSFKIMKCLYNYDQKHDHLIDFSKLLPNGKSFITSLHACSSDNFTSFNNDNNMPNIKEIVRFLLENGVDPNIADKFNVYPIDHAKKSNNKEFASALSEGIISIQ